VSSRRVTAPVTAESCPGCRVTAPDVDGDRRRRVDGPTAVNTARSVFSL